MDSENGRMAAFRFKTCFGCWSLRTGCFLIGVLEILSILLIMQIYGPSRYMIIGLLSITALFIGAFRKNRLFLVMWLFFNCTKVIIIGVTGIFYIIFRLKKVQVLSNDELHKEEKFIAKSFGALSIMVICSFVVYSYFMELREEEELQNRDNVNNTRTDASTLVPIIINNSR